MDGEYRLKISVGSNNKKKHCTNITNLFVIIVFDILYRLDHHLKTSLIDSNLPLTY